MKKYSKIFKKIILLVLITLFLFFLISGFDEVFKIKQIKVVGKTGNYSIIGLDSSRNKNLVLLNSKNLASEIRRDNSQIKSVEIEKTPPDTLILKIEEYTPMSILDNFGTFFALSEDGRIMMKSTVKPTITLPFIHYYQTFDYYSYNAGDWITNIDLLTAQHFLKALLNLGIKVEKVDISGLNMLVFNTDSKKIIFTTERSREMQDYELEQVIRQFKIEGRDFKSIDLRFDKPIVKF